VPLILEEGPGCEADLIAYGPGDVVGMLATEGPGAVRHPPWGEMALKISGNVRCTFAIKPISASLYNEHETERQPRCETENPTSSTPSIGFESVLGFFHRTVI